MYHAREIEQLGPLVNFCPKPLLQILLRPLQSFGILEGVQVGEDTHYPGESVHLANVQELKNLHLESKAGINK